jgi:hypothetical protein
MECCLKKAWGCVSSLIVLALVLYLVFTFFFVPGMVNKLEQTVRDEFQLDETAVVSIRQGPAFNAIIGRFEFLMLKADVATIDGMAIEDLLLRADDVKVDPWQSLSGRTVEITEIGSSFIEFRVGEQALVDRWAPELATKNLTEPELTLDDGLARVSAIFSIGPLKPRVGVSGKIEPMGDGEVRFTASNVEVAGADINLSVINNAFKTLDPVVDLGQLELDVNVSRIKVDDGYIYLTADSSSTGYIEELPGEDGEEPGDIDQQGGLLERFRQISQAGHEDRMDQLGQLYGEMKEKGVSTAEQVREFTAKHLAGWEDDYRWLLQELNEVVESQLAALDEKEAESADSDSEAGEQDQPSEE